MRITTKFLTLGFVALMCLAAQTLKPQTPSIGSENKTTAVADLSTVPPHAAGNASDDHLPEMVLIPGGFFIMGNDNGPKNERPAHEVGLKDFYMGKTEITIAQFKAFADETDYETFTELIQSSTSIIIDTLGNTSRKKGISWRHDEYGNLRPESQYNYPVIHVSWVDAMNYCEWLSKKTGQHYSLPCEVAWEYVASINAKDDDTISCTSEWLKYNSNQSIHAAGMLTAGTAGLYDMTGNVREWCLDDYDKKSYKRSITEKEYINLKHDKYNSKVVRGCGFRTYPGVCSITTRNFMPSLVEYFDIGFRVIMIP